MSSRKVVLHHSHVKCLTGIAWWPQRKHWNDQHGRRVVTVTVVTVVKIISEHSSMKRVYWSMCGRYGRFSRKERIEAVLGRTIEAAGELAPRYNVCPGLPDWVMRQPGPEAAFRFEQFHWGLLPSWAKNPKASQRPINARAETVAERPMFRDLLRERRCVVPIDGYYEWRTTSSGKVPFWFYLKSGEPCFLAGLWDCWHAGKPDALASYILMTTEPNALSAKVHDRMPVMLRARDVPRWLDPTIAEPSQVVGLLEPYPAEEMASRPVSKRVSNPDNEGPELIKEDNAAPELWS
jgi:putative SOS response-associated peptidase YedK